jgi:Ca2+-binding EF-hand superfamily protein
MVGYLLLNYLKFIFIAENSVFKVYSQDEIENFRCIFDMFDKERTGYVNVEDL